MIWLPPRGARRRVAVGVWLGGVGATLLLGWQTTVGPVLFVVTGTHGVHLSDLAVGVNASTAAASVTYLLASPTRRTRVHR